MIELYKLQKLVEDGMSAARIAANYKLDSNEVREIIKENNFSMTLEYFHEGKIDYICELYKSGVSAKSLGHKYSIDKRRVQKWAKEKGELRSKADACRFTYFNEHIMDTIDTPTKAYWLGFFYADAYNCDITNTVNVALKGDDEVHLHKLADFFELDRGKVIRKELIYHLTTLGLAAWYMDDGGLTGNSKVNCRLSTDGFSEGDNYRLLLSKFGLESKVLSYYRGGFYYYLFFNKENSIKMSRMISPYVVECMRYKEVAWDL